MSNRPPSTNTASRRRITSALAAAGTDSAEHRLCATCALLVGTSGAAIAVVSESGHRAVLCSSNAAAGAVEDLQIILGEGPGIDAHRLGVPVTAAELATVAPWRWLGFCAPAIDAGAAAVFAFPLRLGAIQLGTLTFNNDHAGGLSDAQYADASCIVGIVTESVLDHQAKAPRGTVAAPLEALATDSAEVHQAAGMLAVRLGVGVGEALVRLRALAYVDGRSLADLARAVVSGKEEVG